MPNDYTILKTQYHWALVGRIRTLFNNKKHYKLCKLEPIIKLQTNDV